jgi:SARP family transcriptional regulator, regulator of embCAB operon
VATLPDAPIAIQLCGALRIAAHDRGALEVSLPGRQGRIAFAYLTVHRLRPVPRAELLEVLWPDRLPLAREDALSPLVSRMRRLLGADVLTGRHELRLCLPDEAQVDLETGLDALHSAESAVAERDWWRAWMPAHIARGILLRGFLGGLDASWIDEQREVVRQRLASAFECVGEVGLALGGHELASADRSARALIRLEPFRESGYRLLMRTLVGQGNVAEALRTYDDLRQLLARELGAAPGPATQEIHRELLAQS